MLNKKVKALLTADVTWFFGEGMLGPLFAIFAQRVGGNILDISWAWAAYLIFAGLFIVIIGKISDRGRGYRRELVLGGYVLNAILTFGYLLVNSIIGLLLVQIGLGIAAAMATPTWDSLYSEYQRDGERGFAWGMADGISEIFTGIALIIGGAIVVYFSFDSLFVVMGLIQVVSIILLLPALEKDMAKRERRRGGKRRRRP